MDELKKSEDTVKVEKFIEEVSMTMLNSFTVQQQNVIVGAIRNNIGEARRIKIEENAKEIEFLKDSLGGL
jgi:hypothetical protein